MALFKISRGLKSNLPETITDGWCYFTTDDKKFWIDYGNERVPINAKNADTLAGAELATVISNDDTKIPTCGAVYANTQELTEAIIELESKTDFQADWNQNDETAIDYIKNRTHWVENKTLFTLTLDETITVHNQYSDIEAQGYSYKQTNMASWEFTKNIGAINLEELIGGELRFRRKKYDAGLGRYTEIESHTLQITSDFISNDTLLVQVDGLGRFLQLTSSGDLTLFCEGGADSKLPWNYPTSLESLNIKLIDPMFIPKPTEDEAMELLMEMGVITPTATYDGYILTDENGNILNI